MSRKTTPSPGGAASIRERGLVQLLTAVTPEEKKAVRKAALEADLPASHWLRQVIVEAARKAGYPPVSK